MLPPRSQIIGGPAPPPPPPPQAPSSYAYEMNGHVVSFSAETFLNTGQFYLVTKPSS